MKKFLTVFVLVFCFMLSGCSQINYGTIIKEDGSLEEIFEVQLDEIELTKCEIDIDSLFEKIEEKFLIWVYENALNNEIEGFEYDVLKDTKKYKITLSLRYQSIDVYYDFWGIEKDETKTSQKELRFKFFYDELVIREDSNFFDKLKNSSYAKFFYDWLSKNYPNIDWDSKDFKFNYVYAVSSDIGYRSNATKVQRVGDYDFHIWQFDIESKDQSILVFIPILTNRNIACYYVIILLFSAVFGLILYKKFRSKIQSTQFLK